MNQKIDIVKAFGGLSIEFAILLKETTGIHNLLSLLELTDNIKELKLSSY